MSKFLLNLYAVLNKVFANYFANVRSNHPALAPIKVEARIHHTRGHSGDLRRRF